MPYVDYEYYKALYSTAIPEEDFNRLSWDACKLADNATTGIDGMKKLRTAFPTDEDDAEAVKRCICKLIDTAYRLEQAEAAAREAQGYIQRSDGTVVKKTVTSVTAGAESISYATGGSAETAFSKAPDAKGNTGYVFIRRTRCKRSEPAIYGGVPFQEVTGCILTWLHCFASAEKCGIRPCFEMWN